MKTDRALICLLVLWTISAQAFNKVSLSPQDVPNIFLNKGRKAQEINQQFETEHLVLAKVMANFDWKLALNTTYQLDRSQQFSAAMIPGATFNQSVTSATITKAVRSGTVFGLDYNHITQWNNFANGTPVSAITGLPLASIMSQDVIGLTFEQSLWGNSFGIADRSAVRAAHASYEAASDAYKFTLQQSILEAVRAYWDAYVSQETHRAAGSSRQRYQELVTRIQRKSNLGSARPGELAQVRAELEGQNQSVRRSATDYSGKLAALKTLLGISSEDEVEFLVAAKVPQVPDSIEKNADSLRAIKIQKLRAAAAAEGLTAATSLRYPSLNFVGKVYSTGFGRSAAGAWSETLDGAHPRYYAGLKLTYNFGADLQREEVLNKRAALQLEETKLSRSRQEQSDALVQSDLKVKANRANVESAIRMNTFRQEAARELNKAHWQGRIDIKVLIDAINNQFNSEVLLAQAIANYQMSLVEWAAIRDQLLP